MYLDAPVYIWGVQVHMAYLTGKGGRSWQMSIDGAVLAEAEGDLLEHYYEALRQQLGGDLVKLTFLSYKLTFLSLKLTVSLILRNLSLILRYLSLILRNLSLILRYLSFARLHRGASALPSSSAVT
jgi:hypothetical protein